MQEIREAYPGIYHFLERNAPTFPTDRKRRNHLARLLDRLKTIRTCQHASRAIVTVEWTRGGIYGSQARASLEVQFTDGSCTHADGEQSTGCGYDKESTAIASVLNRSPHMLRMFFDRLEAGIQKGEIDPGKQDSVKAVFGYGVSVINYSCAKDYFFDGGVGTSVYPNNFKAIGWGVEHISSGKHHDVWEFAPKEGE